MKRTLLIFLPILSFFSCQQTKAPKPEDPNWIRLEIPNAIEATAIAGDLDKTLLVTTRTKAYYTTDQGKTWQESKNFNGPIPALFTRNDTVFPLLATFINEDGERKATIALYYTTDYGKSWNHVPYELTNALESPVGKAISLTGKIYQIIENQTPANNSPGSYYINPSDIIIRDGITEQKMDFPFKHILHNLHIDGQNRLYVAASGGTYRQQNNTFYCCEDYMPAIIYISRKPQP